MAKPAALDRLVFRADVSTDGLTVDARLPSGLSGLAGLADTDGADGDTTVADHGQGRGHDIVIPREPSSGRRRRRARGDRPRAKTIAPRRLTREELRRGALLAPLHNVPRPVTRAECKDGVRPCPFVSCRYNLYLDVNPETGSIKLNFPSLEVWQMQETCALDVADRGGATLEEVGEILNLTRERIRQVEVRGLLNLKMAGISLRGK